MRVAGKDGWPMLVMAQVFVIVFAGMLLHGTIFTSDAKPEVWPWLVMLSAANLLFVVLLVLR